VAAPQDLSQGTGRAAVGGRSWPGRTATVIVMNADGSPGVTVRADLAAALPALGWLATEFLAGGTVLALIAFACFMVPVCLAATSRADGRPPGS
jgi:hypothetical protein